MGGKSSHRSAANELTFFYEGFFFPGMDMAALFHFGGRGGVAEEKKNPERL